MAIRRPKDALSSTQEKVLEAYLELGARDGITLVTLDKIAKRAKVSFGTVHYYFGGKESELESAAIQYVGMQAQKFIVAYLETLRLSGQPTTGPWSYFRGSFRWAHENRAHSSFWLHFYYLITVRLRPKAANSAFLEGGRKRLESLIFESVGRGELPTLQDVPKLSEKLHSLLIGFMLTSLCDPRKNAEKHFLDLALEAAEAALQEHRSGLTKS